MDDTISRAASLSALNGCTEIYLNNLPPTIYKADAVEAVKALPSATDTNVGGNLIDRQTAIKMAKTYGAEEYERGYAKGKEDAQPRWIPVSDRLPEIGQLVLCSLKTRHYYGKIHVCKYCAADKYCDHSYFDWDHNGFPDVVAWMPLPTPYREGEQDGKN